VSSTSPTGVSRRPEPFDESSPYRPYLGYGRSKMRMELLLRDRHRSGAFEAVVVRAPWFYGPGQPPRQALFFRLIRTGRVPLLGDGSSLRSMAYVDNLCQGLLLAATHPAASGETYWIADRRPYPMAEIVATVERLLERELGLAVAHRRLRLPAPAGDLARLADRLLQALGLYQQKLHVLGEMNVHIAVSVAKAERELGYDPKVELEEGMRRSLADCRERGLGL
jgi:nucleoside-diphosphate-sugar epimerase